MKLINKLFKNYQLKEDSLIDYGFVYHDGIYEYHQLIYNCEFELIISIKNSVMDGKLIDRDFNDEYKQIDSELASGFINELRNVVEEVLLDIREHCYYKLDFIFKQSNIVANYIKEKYHVKPEYLWKSAPGFGVFRNPNNNKWFGIIMNIAKNKIVGQDDKEIEVLNLMLQDKVASYLNTKNFYPAYHMNKKSWISVILDESLSNEEIFNLIDISFHNSNQK